MKLLFSLICFLQLTFVEHDIPVAIFSIHQESAQLQLDINFDVKDLAKSLMVSPSDISKELIGAYLNSNTSFKFDNEINEIEVLDFRYAEDHVMVNAIFQSELGKINHIEIVNTCLLDIEHHSNVIEIDLFGIVKDYRMHKGRKSISINL